MSGSAHRLIFRTDVDVFVLGSTCFIPVVSASSACICSLVCVQCALLDQDPKGLSFILCKEIHVSRINKRREHIFSYFLALIIYIEEVRKFGQTGWQLYNKDPAKLFEKKNILKLKNGFTRKKLEKKI